MAKKNTFTVADYLLTRLKQLDVDDVFQIPGDYVVNFTQTLEDFDGVNAIGTSNELDASYAADAYARIRGLSAVSLQFGVSTYSALNAVAGAYVERSPIVVISATPGADARNIGDMYNVLYHHSTGNLSADQEIFDHVTVASETLSTSEGAPEKIDALLVAAITHSRPVYIACYREVWAEPCPPPGKDKLKPIIPKSEPLQLENAVERAWTQITGAKNPVIFAGVEVLRHGLSDLLQELIDESGMLYTTTSLGKGVLDEKGTKFIGTYADEASVPQVNMFAQNICDLFLSLGTIITDDYLWLVENKYDKMILSTTEDMRVGFFKYEDVTMRDFMKALIKRFKKSKDYPLKVQAPAQPKNNWAVNSDPRFNKTPEVITFNRFFESASNFWKKNKMMDDVVVTLGVSSSMYVATNLYGLSQNGFISSAAWQCIGFETGATLGVQKAHDRKGNKKRSWTVAGDGGFMMICQSLSTLARNNEDGIIFVMNNKVYAIEQVFVDVCSFDYPGDSQFDEFDKLADWDYSAVAQSFGAKYLKADKVSDLDGVFKSLQGIKNAPTLVEVTIPANDLPDQMKRFVPACEKKKVKPVKPSNTAPKKPVRVKSKAKTVKSKRKK